MHRLIALACLPLLSLAACDSECRNIQCGPCPSPISIEVTDALDGSAVPNVRVTSARGNGTCSDAGAKTICTVDAAKPTGAWILEVSADGFMPQSIEVNVAADSGEDCCSCGYESVVKKVALDPA